MSAPVLPRRFGHRLPAATLVVSLLATTGCDPAPPKQPVPQPVAKVTYLTGFGLLGQEAYMFVARDKGYFRDVGLDVDIQPGAGTGENLKLLLAGKADVAAVDLTGALIAYGAGTRGFTVVTAIHQRSTSCIIALSGRGIAVPRDLEGRTIGYQPGGVNYTLFPVYARLAGLDAARVKWVTVPPPQLRAALGAGSVDAITELVVGKPGVEAAAGGRTAVLLPYSDYLTDLYGNVLAIPAGRRPDIVTRFRDAVLRGLLYAIEHPAEAGQIFAKYQPLYKPAVAEAETALMAAYVRSDRAGVPAGALEPQRVMRSIALLQAAGAVPAGITPEQVVSFDLTPGATPTAGR